MNIHAYHNLIKFFILIAYINLFLIYQHEIACLSKRIYLYRNFKLLKMHVFFFMYTYESNTLCKIVYDFMNSINLAFHCIFWTSIYYLVKDFLCQELYTKIHNNIIEYFHYNTSQHTKYQTRKRRHKHIQFHRHKQHNLLMSNYIYVISKMFNG